MSKGVITDSFPSSGGGGSFNPNSSNIGDITPVNTPILDNDSVNAFASKTQGQINQISSDSFINALIFG